MPDILAIGGVLAVVLVALVLARRMTRPLGRSGVLIAAAIVAGGFVAGIALLYRLNEGYVPSELDRAFYPALAIMLAGIILLARSLRLSDNSPLPDFRAIDWLGTRERRWRIQFSRQQMERLERLEADPRTRKYAALIRAGEHWSDDAIQYDLDPDYLASCEHLQPYERAMRQAGISINLSHTHYLGANCCVDIARLDAVMMRPAEVDFVEGPGDRPGEPGFAMLHCRAHQRSISVIHASEARPGTRWFPSPPKAL